MYSFVQPVNKCPLNSAHPLSVQKQTTSAVLVGIYIKNHILLNSSEEVPPISHKGCPKEGSTESDQKKNVSPHLSMGLPECNHSQVFPSSLPSFANHALIYIRFLYHFTYCIAILLQNTLQFQGGI